MKKNVTQYKHCCERCERRFPNGGIMGSGISVCSGQQFIAMPSDGYCNFMKIFNVLMVMGIIASVLFLYTRLLRRRNKERLFCTSRVMKE
jgi:hypothetical protein